MNEIPFDYHRIEFFMRSCVAYWFLDVNEFYRKIYQLYYHSSRVNTSLLIQHVLQKCNQSHMSSFFSKAASMSVVFPNTPCT